MTGGTESRLDDAVRQGDLDAFLALCNEAVERGDDGLLRHAVGQLSLLPAGAAPRLVEKVRERFPKLVAGIPALVGVGGEPLAPSTGLNVVLQKAVGGDREGALRLIAAGRADGAPGGAALAEAIVRALPDPAALPRPLVVDHGEDVLVTAPGERGTLVVFTGMGERVWLDLPVFDAWVAEAGFGAVYLRDRSRLLYTQGQPGRGGAEALSALLSDVRQRTHGELAFLGSSSGGYGALYWAIRVGVGRTLAFGAPTSTATARLQALGDERALMLQKLLLPPEGGPDLREMMLETGHAGRVDLYYGADMPIDRAHAEYLDLPTVTRHPVDGWSHHQALLPLAAAGRLPAILRGD